MTDNFIEDARTLMVLLCKDMSVSTRISYRHARDALEALKNLTLLIVGPMSYKERLVENFREEIVITNDLIREIIEEEKGHA